MAENHAFTSKVLEELPSDIRDSLGKNGPAALEAAIDKAHEAQWTASPHGIDARYNFPWLGGRAYLRVLAGKEKRPRGRTKRENRKSVGRRVANFVAILFLACGFYTFAGLGLLMASAVLE